VVVGFCVVYAAAFPIFLWNLYALLGGVIATFGLVFDLIGFVLFLVFVAASSIIRLRRGDADVRAAA